MTRLRQGLCRCLLVGVVLAVLPGCTWVPGTGVRPSSRQLVARPAYKPILRRDPTINQNMQKWMGQQLRLVKRQEAGGFSNPTERKQLYLKKLGLDKKADEIEQKKQRPPWHLPHIVAGDKFIGNFQHPDLYRGEQLDLKFTATSDTEATIFSRRGDIDDIVTFKQDYPIAFEPGEQKDQDMTAYAFHKFNEKWRDFEQPMPKEEDCQHMSLPMLQQFFRQVANVEGFPSESEYAENCADSSKGMTREDARVEFLKYLRAESQDYLEPGRIKDKKLPHIVLFWGHGRRAMEEHEKGFKGIFTGRRLQFTDGKLAFDGDFQTIGDNLIYGFVTLGGEPGGTFSLELPLVKQPFWWYGLACRIFGEFACSVVGDLLRVKKKN